MRSKDTILVRKLATERGLTSCMNDTKWREVCEGFRAWPIKLRYRIRDLLAPAGYISGWDGEWYYHPLPYVSIEWLEAELPAAHIQQAVELCKRIGAPVEVAGSGVRIWGWVGSGNQPDFV